MSKETSRTIPIQPRSIGETATTNIIDPNSKFGHISDPASASLTQPTSGIIPGSRSSGQYGLHPASREEIARNHAIFQDSSGQRSSEPPPHSTSRNPRSRSRNPRSRISLYSITTDNGHPDCIWKLGDQVIHRGLDQGPPALSDWSNRTLLRAHDNYNLSSMEVLLQSKVAASIFIVRAREAGPGKIHILYNQTFPSQRNTPRMEEDIQTFLPRNCWVHMQ